MVNTGNSCSGYPGIHMFRPSKVVSSNGDSPIGTIGHRRFQEKMKLVGGLERQFYFPINIGLISSSQLTFISFRGVA